MSDVPCAGCTACCKNEIVLLFPERGDKVELLDHYEIETPQGTLRALKRKDNGDCIYMQRDGCAIYANRPSMCRAFDCRLWYQRFQAMKKRDRKRHGEHNDVLAAGKARLLTLSQ